MIIDFEVNAPGRKAISLGVEPNWNLLMHAENVAEESMPRRILLMVRELHRRGYERLRVAPSLFASGRWTCCVTPVTNISWFNGVWECDFKVGAHYSSGQGAHCFDWTDAADDTPEQLATKFIERFPDLSEQGRGRDEAYADWYSEMLTATEPAGLVFAEDRWVLPDDELHTIGVPEGVKIPLPPPGEGGEKP